MIQRFGDGKVLHDKLVVVVTSDVPAAQLHQLVARIQRLLSVLVEAARGFAVL